MCVYVRERGEGGALLLGVEYEVSKIWCGFYLIEDLIVPMTCRL
jgi:hypothetical protein